MSGRVANAPAAMGSRWRCVPFNPVNLCGMSRLQHVADEMPGSCGALPECTLRIPRESRVPHRTAERRLLGTSCWVEKRTVHELFCGVHDDLFTTKEEEGPLLHRPDLLSSREEEEL